MTLVTLCSAKGSPGVTTLTCALGAVWPAQRSVLLAECDPSGGDLAVRFGLSGRSGIASYLFGLRDSGSDPHSGDHCQRLPGGLDVLVGAVGTDAAAAIDRELAHRDLAIAGARTRDGDVLADCGRITSGAVGQQRVLRSATVAILVTRPDAPAIAHARHAVSRLRAEGASGSSPGVFVATLGTGPFRPREIHSVLAPDRLFEVPDDPAAADRLSGHPGDPRVLARSSLIKSAREIVEALGPALERDDAAARSGAEGGTAGFELEPA